MANEPSGISIWSPKIANESVVRKFISLNGNGYIAIAIQDNSTSSQAVPVDPDPESLNLAIWWNDVLTSPLPTNPYGTQVLTVTQDSITQEGTGQFFYNIGPALTANRGLLTAIWTYTVNGTAFQFTDHLQVLDPQPLYDSLSDQEKVIVEQVSWMFGDLYDSTNGGPHLIEEFQTHWNYERIAQMMTIAVTRMNMIGNYGNPPTTWSVGSAAQQGSITVPGRTVTQTQTLPNGTTNSITYTTNSSTSGGNNIPVAFAGLLTLGTYIECMRHFRDTYTEIPNRAGMDVTYTDRRDYWNRWQSNLQAEVQQWEQWVKNAKFSMLNTSSGSLLIAGGIYGGSSMVYVPGMQTSAIRSMRFYPASPSVSWSAFRH